ncbi:hypothetical protein BDP81DRAFT_335112 [Colletotrichum phormii]|uniref:CorA-like transporter domain-containing protein n=1 Tax=Colletotrichum phormii TaxID=359342 RepID=A0AAI9ZEY1_9PEZI|nr:uncharacterized protein BDP81DRAFT_335112 [Colletotrichum phormii]KAK1622206.1 hypothetical protein BDP81DRAFT_335112 [Colletotrichum phormii]
MILAPQCYVDEVTEPVILIDVMRSKLGSGKTDTEVTYRRYSNTKEIKEYFSNPGSEAFRDRYISICQAHSWDPLEITPSMLESLTEVCGLGSSIYDLTTSFYRRVREIEETFCIPLIECTNELAYTMRYPELKPMGNDWVLRQTGIYHKFDAETSQNTYVLLSPSPDSKLKKQAEHDLLHCCQTVENDSFWLHKMFQETCLPNWRMYNASLERKFLPMADTAAHTFIEELSVSQYSHLTDLADLENRFLQTSIILTASQDVLECLIAICADMRDTSTDCKTQIQVSKRRFQHSRRVCAADHRTATYLHQRSRTTAQLLANALSFREQLESRAQNSNMLSLNKSAVFITTLTLLYLPPSFIATFFGMNFFDLDTDTGRIVGSSMVWIFVLCSGILTAITFMVYRLLLSGDVMARISGKTKRIHVWWRHCVWYFRRRKAVHGEKVHASV